MKIAYIGIDLFYPALETLYELGCEIIEIFTCKTDNICEFNVKVTDFAKKHSIPCKINPINRDDIQKLIDNGKIEIIPIDVSVFEGMNSLQTTIPGVLCVCPDVNYEGFFIAKIKRIK